MRQAADTWFVLGLPWWPFDGAVSAALIALVGTAITIGFNRRRFNKAEENQDARLTKTLDSTRALGGREQLLIDLRRAEDALASSDKKQWVFAAVTLRLVRNSSYAEDDDKRRAREIIAAYAARVRPSSSGGGVR